MNTPTLLSPSSLSPTHLLALAMLCGAAGGCDLPGDTQDDDDATAESDDGAQSSDDTGADDATGAGESGDASESDGADESGGPDVPDGGPIDGDGLAILPLFAGSPAATVAVDANGGMHVAATVHGNDGDVVVYSHCASDCSSGASWSGTTLAASGITQPPTIALTGNGHPRIAFHDDLGAAPGHYYLECDEGCDDAGNWRGLQLTADISAPIDPLAELPFAVADDGRVAFAFEDNAGSYVMSCATNCADASSWGGVALGNNYLDTEELVFGKDGSLQLVARDADGNGNGQLVWARCAGDCTVGTSWAAVGGLWVTQSFGAIEASIALTANGAPRIVLIADDPNTPETEKVVALVSCDSGCEDGTGWTLAGVPIDAARADKGLRIAVDASGRPTIAHLGAFAAGYARCTGDCAAQSGWETVEVITTTELLAQAPFDIPADCAMGYWSFEAGPSLGLDAAGAPVFAFSASMRASGGADCYEPYYIAGQSFAVMPK